MSEKLSNVWSEEDPYEIMVSLSYITLPLLPLKYIV